MTVDREAYYISRALCGQHVTLLLNAPERVLDVWLGNQTIKQLPLKGLIGHPLPLSRYIQLMLDQARSEERQLRFRRQRLVQHTLWA
ncbi:hypothetical protein [Ktedonobacter racemifer]|uniref:hypothetical protein n=1 Tax=Ktedonobacter racemifer TaxID=363277 RepID=UPI000948E561|nr:hypothetical protein [Ktedonobacter racemifer]